MQLLFVVSDWFGCWMCYSFSSEITLVILRPVTFCYLIFSFVRNLVSFIIVNRNIRFFPDKSLIFLSVVFHCLQFQNCHKTRKRPWLCLYFSVLSFKVVLSISSLNVWSNKYIKNPFNKHIKPYHPWQFLTVDNPM